MIGLLRVELTRFRWRRAVLILVVAAVVVPGIILAATAWNTRPISAEDRQHAEQQVKIDSQDPSMQREVRRCVARPGRYGAAGAGDAGEVRAACEAMMLPQVEWYVSRPTLDLDSERKQGSGLAVVVVLTMLMLLIGTTFVGHDWNSGSMSNQLLFQPRRMRVWAVKGAAVLLAGLLVTGVVLGAYWTGLWLIARHRGLHLHDGAVTDAYQQALLGALLAACAGLGGYALTMLFRSTVATLGVLFAVAIAGPLLITLLGFPGHQQLMPQNNFAAVMRDGFRTPDYDRPGCFVNPGRQPEGCVVRISTAGGASYFGGLLLLAGVPSLLSFRRRDVP
jgi:hypothetical protein